MKHQKNKEDADRKKVIKWPKKLFKGGRNIRVHRVNEKKNKE
jgi:hypothetical protein